MEAIQDTIGFLVPAIIFFCLHPAGYILYMHQQLRVIGSEQGSPLLYSEISNVIGTLNEQLQKVGEEPAVINSFAHNSSDGLKSFSAKVFFTLRGEKKEYQSDTRYRNKKDARQNAAYVALVALNLVKPTVEPRASPPEETRNSDLIPSQTSSQQTPNQNFKNFLQEYCQKNGYLVPEYRTENVGDQHHAAFKAIVEVTLNDGQKVRGISDKLITKKAAEFQAAERAYNSILTRPPVVEQTSITDCRAVSPPIETRNSSPRPRQTSSHSTEDKNYKNLLQEYCQKNNHPVPEYKIEDVGDQHFHLFKATVTVKLNDGREIKGTSDKLDTKKAASFQAAERAYKILHDEQPVVEQTSITDCRAVSPPIETRNSSPRPRQTSSHSTEDKNYKNLLQEYCQKNNHPVPEYKVEDVGDQHFHLFEATVTVKLNDGQRIRRTSDMQATKKAAEFQAAERAYNSL